MLWKIYYDDGSAFSDLDGAPTQAPARGVQVVVNRPDRETFVEVGAVLLWRHDYYWFENGSWYGSDLTGLLDFLLRSGRFRFAGATPRRYEGIEPASGLWVTGDEILLFDALARPGHVKFGRFVSRQRFRETADRAEAEIGKHAWYPDEPRP